MIIDSTEYRQVAGFSKYWIGSDGSVGTFVLLGNPRRTGDFRLLKHSDSGCGYRQVMLIDDSGSKRTVLMHRMVLLAFVGPCPDGYECCHGNGLRSDNRVENLRWDSRSGNHGDKWRHGTQQAGSQNGLAILCEEDVVQIKTRLAGGDLLRNIAMSYGVKVSTISKIRSGKNWAHIMPDLHSKFPDSNRSRMFGVNIRNACSSAGISKSSFYQRVRSGMSMEQALAPKERRRPLK